MGKHFGELGVIIRGIVYYKLAAREQQAFAGAAQGIVNFAPRILSNIMMWLPNFLWGYGVYRYCEYINWTHHRKNPADYANEVDPAPPKVCKRAFEPPPKCKKNLPEPEDEESCDD